jgi:hypothetical protein
MPLQAEYATLERDRPRLLREVAEVRDGSRFVLVKGDTIYGPWDTCSDAVTAGLYLFGDREEFLVTAVEAQEEKYHVGRPARCRG